MFIIYQSIYFLALLIASPFFLIKAAIGGHGIKERLGGWNFKPDNRKTAWFHAASVGEMKVIATVCSELRKITPDLRIIISTMTKTGKAKAADLPFAAEVYYLPLDIGLLIARVIRITKPAFFVLVETELWPALIKKIHDSKVPLLLINGRISGKSFRYYRLFKPLTAKMLKKIDHIMAQSEADAIRFTRLGAEPEKVNVYGNTKFDQILSGQSKPRDVEIDYLPAGNRQFVFIAGSVREGEFDIIAQAVSMTKTRRDDIIYIIAPRHLKELNQLEIAIRNAGLTYDKRTGLREPGQAHDKVIVLDTMGELGDLYGKADLAFVGGSLVNIGGHDPLEPASRGCAVCFGPHMENSGQFSGVLVDSGGAFHINNASELTELICRLAGNRDLARQVGDKACRTVSAHTGASRKIAAKLAELL